MERGELLQGIHYCLSELAHFSRLLMRQRLYRYQLEPLEAVVASVLGGQGREFLMVFPRQSGKNEAAAQLESYLLTLFQRRGGQMVHAATGDAIGMAIGRLEEKLDQAWTRERWRKGSRPDRRILGRAAVLFLSSHPAAHSRGQTAHWLLVVDEIQDQAEGHLESVFTPMRAAHNATALYLGTVKLRTDYLWRKKGQLEREQARDGVQRVFMVGPERVCEENPAYAAFLEAQVAKYGRHHPIIASEYYLEPMDGAGRLFDARRRALMQGRHPRRMAPEAKKLYLATLDLAGQDEASTDPLARLEEPGRDYTVATVFELVLQVDGRLPVYRAVDTLVDQGSRHFQEVPGRPALVERLLAWLEHWGVGRLVGDCSGVGEGVMDWLAQLMGRERVSGYSFSGRGKKAGLGCAFLALVETGRFQFWSGDQDIPLSDGWWFWRQVEACRYAVPPNGRIELDLQWGVDPRASIDTPAGPALIHDDRLLSAALVAELDRLYRQGELSWGRGESAMIAPAYPEALEGY